MLIITILAPVGVENSKEAIIPTVKQIKDIAAEDRTTPLKLLKTLIEVNAGNIIRLEISMVPIILMPMTIVRAVNKAISIL